ncbi:MAG TPA: hypothetical protein VHA12_02120 [Candidatus Nanoarchaeia archaeon]|nr:hypothetical protein [Candidatus Nanoarchaeia archaeon]
MRKEILILSLLSLFLVYKVSALDLTSMSANETVISKQIVFSEPYSGVISSFFGLPESNLNLQSFVLLAVLFFSSFLIVNSALSLIEMFQRGILRQILALSVTCLISLSGGFHISFNILMSAANAISLFNSPKLVLLIPVSIIIFISLIILVLLRTVKKIFVKEQAHSAGFEIGKNIAETKMYSTIFNKGR